MTNPFDFLTLQEDLRMTTFDIEGKKALLGSARGMKRIPDAFLKHLINRAGVMICQEIRDKADIAHNHMSTMSEVLSLPDDLMFLQQIRIYEDYNPTLASGTCDAGGSATLLVDADGDFVDNDIAADHRVDNTTDGSSAMISAVTATQLTTADLVGGTNNTFAEDDEYEVYDPDAATENDPSDSTEIKLVTHFDALGDNSTGVPTKAMLWQSVSAVNPEGFRYLQLNTLPDARYFYDVYFYSNARLLENQTDFPDTQFHDLLYQKAAELVALRIGDVQSKRMFGGEYREWLSKVKALHESQATPEVTQYRHMP